MLAARFPNLDAAADEAGDVGVCSQTVLRYQAAVRAISTSAGTSAISASFARISDALSAGDQAQAPGTGGTEHPIEFETTQTEILVDDPFPDSLDLEKRKDSKQRLKIPGTATAEVRLRIAITNRAKRKVKHKLTLVAGRSNLSFPSRLEYKCRSVALNVLGHPLTLFLCMTECSPLFLRRSGMFL